MTKEDILNYLKEHKVEFARKYGVEDIALFGSYARDEATKESDIDIFVKMEPKLFKLIGLKQEIEENLQKNIDIIREHNNIKPFFLKIIKKDMIYV